MKNKKLYIGLGIAAVAGFVYYTWSKKDESEDTSEIKKTDNSSSTDIKSSADGDCGCGCKGEPKSNIGSILGNDCYKRCMTDTQGNSSLLCKEHCGSSRKVKIFNNDIKSSFYGNAPIYQGREVVSMATPYIPNGRKPVFYAY